MAVCDDTHALPLSVTVDTEGRVADLLETDALTKGVVVGSRRLENNRLMTRHFRYGSCDLLDEL